MPNRPQKVTKSRRSALKLEALETRQLLAGVTGAGTEVGKDIQHPNGNIYDQVLMTGSSVTVTADPGQVTRVSFLDASGDIVQAEFAGAGSLTVSLAGATGPVAPDADKYNQSVQYMKGTATFTIQGSDATTNFGVFSVGTGTANAGAANPIFTDASGKAITGGNHIADIQRITVVADPSKPNGSTFGGIRAGNAVFSGSSGVVGISAAGVQVQDVVTIGDLDASGSAIPTLIFGTNSQFGSVTVSGGDLVQTSGVSISNTGSYAYQIVLGAGADSSGKALPAATASSTTTFTGSNPFNLVNNTFALTTAPDQIPGLVGTAGTGTAGNDTINGSLGGTSPTFTALDSVDAGTGTDTFNIIDLTGGSAQPASTSIKNVETVNLRSVGAANLDVSTWTGVTALNVTQATSALLTAPSTTAVTVAGVTGGVTVTGGSTQSITSQLGANAIVSNGGSTVNVTATGTTTGTISIGGTTAPTGAVTVSSTGPSIADTNATKEVVAVTYAANSAAAQTEVFDGTTVTLVDTDASTFVEPTEIATQVAAATYTNWTAVNSGGGVVTFTAKTFGNKTDLVAGNFTGTNTSTETPVVSTQGLPLSFTQGGITVTGGTTVSVTESAGSTTGAATLANSYTMTEGTITVTGADKGTSVTVIEDPTVAAKNAVTAVTAAKEVTEVTFSAITSGQTVTVGGLTFTAAKDLDAAGVAAAFANLTASAFNGPAAVATGTYSGQLVSTFVSSAAASGKVVFTGATAGNPTDLAIGAGTGTAPIISANTQGIASVSGVTGVLGVTAGQVVISDAGSEADTITTVNLTGFGGTGGGASSVNSDVLSTISLTNSVDDVTVATNATTLGVTMNQLGISSTSLGTNTATVTLPSTVTTVNLTATGTGSFVDFIASGAKSLTVNGSKVADLTIGGLSNLGALQTVVVTDTAGLKLPSGAAAALTSVDTSGTTGAVSASINPNQATYNGGAGADTVTTVTSGTISKAISLGGGDDSLTLLSGSAVPSVILDGGTGTDTLGLTAADAASLSATTLFGGQIVNFEKLAVAATAAGASPTVNLDNLKAINYVVSSGGSGSTEAFTVTFTGNSAAASTVIYNGTTVTLADTDASTAVEPTEIATQLAAATYTNWTAVNSGGGVVTFTNKASGPVTDAVAGDFTGTAASAKAVAVTTQGATGGLSLTNMLTGGTLELKSAAVATSVALKDATPTTDTFTIVTNNGSDTNFGTVTIPGVESLTLNATDSSTSTINTHTIDIKAAAATSLMITGNANVTLTPDASNAALATIDGSAMTGKLSASGGGTVATTVKGGSASDTLTAAFTGDVLQGGAGDDTLVVAGKSLVTLTGGAGNDTFNVSAPTANVNAYATITDLTAGDVIKFAASSTNFSSTALTLDPSTAVFQDYANLAIASTTLGAVRWFQFGGNTYIVENVSGSATAFQNGTDIIVKVSGLVNLATASYNGVTGDTLLIV